MASPKQAGPFGEIQVCGDEHAGMSVLLERQVKQQRAGGSAKRTISGAMDGGLAPLIASLAAQDRKRPAVVCKKLFLFFV